MKATLVQLATAALIAGGLIAAPALAAKAGGTVPGSLVVVDTAKVFTEGGIDKAKARETRRAMLEAAMEDRRILVPCHFRGKLGCRLARHGDGFVIAR